jgi:hypothetical protein
MKPFLTEKDIIEQVADEMGYPVKSVHLMWKFILQRLGQMTVDPDCMTIYLPYVGCIYEKMGMLKYYSKLYSLKKNPTISEKRVEDKRQKRIKALDQALQENGRYLSPHYIRVTNTNKYYVGYMTYAEQEELQNTTWKPVELKYLHPVQSTLPYGKVFKPAMAEDYIK